MILFWAGFAASIGAAYAALVSALAVGLLRASKPHVSPHVSPQGPSQGSPQGLLPFISVVTAARNEEANIEACLEALSAQSYPSDRYEAIVVDDHSTDGTLRLARAAAERFAERGVSAQALSMAELEEAAQGGKQRALDAGIQRSRGEIIASVDADCRPSAGWLAAIAARFAPETGVAVGFSMLDRPGDGGSWFVKAQSLELLGLFSAFAGCIGLGKAVACTGNNIAYRRAVYDQMGGLMRMGSTVAEDNMFLQWVSRRTDWRIEALFEPESIVHTEPMPNLRSFFMQRLRWASNSAENRFFAVWFMTTVYAAYLLAPALLVAACLGAVPFWAAGAFWALKLLPEWAVLWIGLSRFRRRDLWVYLPASSLLHTAYALATGLLGLSGRADWKGRRHRSRGAA